METGIRILTATDINTTTSAKMDTLGATGMTADGRDFVYASFGGTSTINPGLLMVASALTANSTGLAITAVGTGTQSASNLLFGSTTLVVTNGATAVTQDQFADGFLEVLWSGGGFTVRINGNTAAAASGYITVTLAPGGLQNFTGALVPGTDTVNLTVSPWANVVPSTTVAAPLGVTIVPVANTASVSNFGWIQVSGHCLIFGTSVKGQGVKQATGTAGYIAVTAASTDFAIGVAKETVTGANAPVELHLT